MLELLEQEEPELLFGELRIDEGQGHSLEGQIPGGEPGIFPFVRHRQDAHRVEMLPAAITNGAP